MPQLMESFVPYVLITDGDPAANLRVTDRECQDLLDRGWIEPLRGNVYTLAPGVCWVQVEEFVGLYETGPAPA